MLSEGRIPLQQAEHDAIDKLIAKHKGAPVSFTRQDPGDLGPVVVYIGGDVYIVQADGKTKKKAS